MRFFYIVIVGALLITGCVSTKQTASTNTPDTTVVLYCSIDEVYAKPLIEKLRARTGLNIVALFDTESTKTAGLTSRIRAEKARPRADVLWTSALLQTLLLSRDGMLQPYDAPAARDLPAQFRGAGWVAVGTRGRLIVATPSSGFGRSGVDAINTRLTFVPLAMDKTGHSNPQFGTASDEAAALYARDPGAALKWYRDLKASKVRILPGNGDVARAVADGDLGFGWADTDDYLAQKARGKKIFAVSTVGNNVLVPGAVALIKGAPHAQNARKLFDAIASSENEKALVAQMPGVFSLRARNDADSWKSGGQNFIFLGRASFDDYSKWPAAWDKVRPQLTQIFQP